MAECYKPADIVKICDSADLQASSGGLLIDIKAFKSTKHSTKKFTLSEISVVDPTTGAYPLVTSEYYPIKIDWDKNAVKTNYEVVSSEVRADKYTQLVSGVIISDSESNEGKENAMALSTRKFVFVVKISGVNDAEDAYHVFGAKNGLQYVIEPTSDEVGGRITGSLRSLAGGAEPNPNGYNFILAGGLIATDVLFNNRLNTVGI